jgi:TetR/AcrR family transcriptional repressor of nem operon
MGRSKSFADVEVVRAAREVFWTKGYESTGVADLENATGLNRSSIYHAFGSKRGLFDEAVESYLDDVVRPRLAPLASANVESGALEGYLTGLRRAMVDELTSLSVNGCLLLNATAALLGHEDGLQEVVTKYTTELRAGVTAGAIARHPGLDAERLELIATTVTGLVFASMVVVRVDQAAAGRMLDAALSAATRSM